MSRARVAAAMVAAVGLVGCASGPIPWTPLTTTPTSTSVVPTVIPPYGSDAFRYWSDLDGDGCSTRDEVLAASAVEFNDTDGDGCAGTDEFVAVLDPYTERTVYPRGEIDIDHVVARKDAWESGAWAWDDDQREAFANDPVNLIATDDGVNRAKSDRGPDEWQPDAHSGWCRYATAYRDTKLTYRLTITPGEVTALNELLATC